MTAAITPGPWKVKDFSIQQAGYTIAMVWPDGRVSSNDSFARMAANSKAIAAVPAMIDALQKAWPVLDAIACELSDDNGATVQEGGTISPEAARTAGEAADRAMAVRNALQLAGIEVPGAVCSYCNGRTIYIGKDAVTGQEVEVSCLYCNETGRVQP